MSSRSPLLVLRHDQQANAWGACGRTLERRHVAQSGRSRLRGEPGRPVRRPLLASNRRSRVPLGARRRPALCFAFFNF